MPFLPSYFGTQRMLLSILGCITLAATIGIAFFTMVHWEDTLEIPLKESAPLPQAESPVSKVSTAMGFLFAEQATTHSLGASITAAPSAHVRPSKSFVAKPPSISVSIPTVVDYSDPLNISRKLFYGVSRTVKLIGRTMAGGDAFRSCCRRTISNVLRLHQS